MTNLAVVGAQWGDEGKGKIVDLLAHRFSLVARFQGGPNAGHTVVFDGKSHALHHIPSGIFHDGVVSVVGPGSVMDPDRILGEIDGLIAQGVPVAERLRISSRVHVILPHHRTLDGAYESRLKGEAIGTTRRGIGPAYSAKMQRLGVRLADLADAERLEQTMAQALDCGLRDLLERLGEPVPEPSEIAALARGWWERLGPLCCDTSDLLHDALDAKRPILFEGAQGTLLDVDHGSYPFVTSSSTVAGGIPGGLGVPPRAVERVIGVVKAYLTRVGAGPFPTEETGAFGDQLRDAGNEYGTTTGRPRRCGFFDAVAARYAVRLNGLDALAVTKFDVLSGLDTVKIAVAYELDGERLTTPPACAHDLARVKPVYEVHPGWEAPSERPRRLEDLPESARRYLDRLTEPCGCPLGLVSVGPDRTETIIPRGSLLEEYGCSAT